jgi:hypothetical protein
VFRDLVVWVVRREIAAVVTSTVDRETMWSSPLLRTAAPALDTVVALGRDPEGSSPSFPNAATGLMSGLDCLPHAAVEVRDP